ncbi:endonuclease-reverse transcriptase [Trichonephila clavipes]|nr:endonuclease-reverse transcriptase [Trichonephila clavipes]
MNEDRCCKKIFLAKSMGNRPRGRPPLRWIDCVEKDLNILKVKNWKTVAKSRNAPRSETWTLNLETIRALETFERKALRTIFGPVKDQGCWRTRYNFELYRIYKEPQVTQVIRSNRLRWLGHIWRSPENNQTRTYTFKNPMGSRTRGRPPTRWMDDVENDLKTLNIKNWQRVAAYRWNWRKRAMEAAKTCNRKKKKKSVVVCSRYMKGKMSSLDREHHQGSRTLRVRGILVIVRFPTQGVTVDFKDRKKALFPFSPMHLRLRKSIYV